VDWSLLGCGRSGHVTYAPDEPAVRAQLTAATAATAGGPAWRCLRCATYVPGPPDETGPAAAAPRPRRGREVRSALILRVFAVERFLRALVFAALAYGLWRFSYARHSLDAAFDRERPVVRDLLLQLGYDINHSKLVGLIQHALTLSRGTLTLLAVGALAYAAVEVVEGTGLWLGRRWGEYFAMVATCAGLPLEIDDLAHRVTVTALILLLVNLALVVYLIATKRLLGVRGGRRAYDAMLRSESVMEAAIAAAAASPAAIPAGPPAPPDPAAAAGPAAAAATVLAATGPATTGPAVAAPEAAPPTGRQHKAEAGGEAESGLAAAGPERPAESARPAPG
jgi:uncharacterized membrane protein (DUF2068 family)